MRHFSSPITALFYVLLLTVVMVCPRAVADDQATYESLSDVKIGRVFFSPEQRTLLDKRRLGQPAITANRRSASTAPRKTETDSAGFIINSSGVSKVYKRGDFVASDVPDAMVFPGDVAFGRQEKSQATSNQDNPDAAEPSDADK